MRLTDEQVREAMALADKATEGPYEALPDDQGMASVPICTVWAVDSESGYRLNVVAYVPIVHGRTAMPYEENSNLFAASRTLVPALCADLLDSRAEIAEKQRRIEELEGALKSSMDIFSKLMERGSETQEGGGFKKVDPALVFLPALHAKAAINNVLEGRAT